jgi:hypothetical protein
VAFETPTCKLSITNKPAGVIWNCHVCVTRKLTSVRTGNWQNSHVVGVGLVVVLVVVVVGLVVVVVGLGVVVLWMEKYKY